MGKVLGVLFGSAARTTATALVAVLGLLIAYYPIAKPDIRYTLGQSPNAVRFIDQTMTEDGNFLFNTRFDLEFKNLSMKPGLVDRIELVPVTVGTIPEISVTHIDRRRMRWRQTERVALQALITVETGWLGPPAEQHQIVLELKAFDDEGQSIDLYEDGRTARITFDLSGDIERSIRLLQ